MCDVIPYFHRTIFWDVRPLGIFNSYSSVIQNKIVFGTLVRISNLTNLAVASWDFSCLLSLGLYGRLGKGLGAQVHIDGLSHPTTPTALSHPTTPVTTATAQEPTVEDNTEDEHDFMSPFEEIIGEEGNPDDMQYLEADESKGTSRRVVVGRSYP